METVANDPRMGVKWLGLPVADTVTVVKDLKIAAMSSGLPVSEIIPVRYRAVAEGCIGRRHGDSRERSRDRRDSGELTRE